MSNAVDETHMRRCLQLARRAEGRTAPNPAVGCVIVDRGGRVVAEGWHRGPGTLHAEADALAKLSGKARGHTLYCNLEPCHHKKNRTTEPCSSQVARAGISRLVIGMGDPIRGHAGGARFLRKQGVEVVRNVLRKQCAELNRPFVIWAKTGRPQVVVKAAVSLDGRIATRTGESQWITSASARRHGHRMRNRLDAILVGIGTVLADDPRLTVRGVRGGRDPIRIVVDSRLRTPVTAKLLPAVGSSDARTIVATTARAPATRERRLRNAGAEVWRLGSGHKVDLQALLARLGTDGVTSVLVEGGAGIHGALMDEDLADDLLLYMAPRIIGGPAPSWVAGQGAGPLAEARGFKVVQPVEMLGPDLLVRARRTPAPR